MLRREFMRRMAAAVVGVGLLGSELLGRDVPVDGLMDGLRSFVVTFHDTEYHFDGWLVDENTPTTESTVRQARMTVDLVDDVRFKIVPHGPVRRVGPRTPGGWLE